LFLSILRCEKVVFDLPPPLKLVAMIYIVAEILLKVALKHQKSINQSETTGPNGTKLGT
jgi:hypothetical protein